MADIASGTAPLLASELTAALLAVNRLVDRAAPIARCVSAGRVWYDPRRAYQFHGTRAQLVEQGLIPDDLMWPHRGQPKFWEECGRQHFLRRCCPVVGAAWADADYWVLDMSPIPLPPGASWD